MEDSATLFSYRKCALLNFFGALAGFFGVALGAFGAHALRTFLEATGTTHLWQTAVLYHLIHALPPALLRPAPLPAAKISLSLWATVAFLLGILLFSGSLYALALGAPRGLGLLTPFGGLAFLAGWALLAAAHWSSLKPPRI